MEIPHWLGERIKDISIHCGVRGLLGSMQLRDSKYGDVLEKPQGSFLRYI
jgi:hypothetical protein